MVHDRGETSFEPKVGVSGVIDELRVKPTLSLDIEGLRGNREIHSQVLERS